MRPVTLFVILALALVPLAAQARDRVPDSDAEIQLSFAPVVRTASKAVVNIYAKRIVEDAVSPFASDPFFSQFFGLERSVPRVENSLGSGVILSSDGIVVSNHHVVGDAAEIRIVLPDRREFEGQIVLSDAKADLAVIRLIGARDLPALALGDSDAIEVGDLVLAIGNPFGVGQTVTSGIVSGLARSGGGSGGSGGYFIQTDAPINPGNSGGALVDMAGRLIGINTSILTRSGGSNGIGFAIPANLVKQYVAQAREGHTTFTHPWSGLRVQTVESDLAKALGETAPRGVLIQEIHSQSPFADAGLQVGDVILSLDGQPVDGPAELEYRLASHGLGASVSVGFIRDGSEQETAITLAAVPDNAQAAALRIAARTVFDGMVVTDLTPRMIEQLDLPLDAEGVIVLETSGYSQRSGLRPGDVLLSVNGTTLLGAADAAARLAEPRSGWRIEMRRGDRRMILEMRG